MSLCPLMTWDRIEPQEADAALVAWGHWLGACDRPFGLQAFGLTLYGELVATAVSASTVNAACHVYRRGEVIELARLCARPDHRDLTRVALRLWRKTAAEQWRHWQAVAYVSYANSNKHTGDVYRFDGWKKAKDVPGGDKKDSRTGKTVKTDPKSLWVYHFGREIDLEQRAAERKTRADETGPAGASADLPLSLWDADG